MRTTPTKSKQHSKDNNHIFNQSKIKLTLNKNNKNPIHESSVYNRNRKSSKISSNSLSSIYTKSLKSNLSSHIFKEEDFQVEQLGILENKVDWEKDMNDYEFEKWPLRDNKEQETIKKELKKRKSIKDDYQLMEGMSKLGGVIFTFEKKKNPFFDENEENNKN